MSEQPAPDAPETPAAAPASEPAKKSGKKLIVIIAVVVLLAAGGGGFFYWKSSTASAETSSKSKKAKADDESEDEDSEDKDAEDEDSAEKESGDAKSGDEGEEPKKKKDTGIKASLPADEEVANVVDMPPFVVNLADTESARYLRIAVSLGIGEGESEAKPDPLFTTRVRNALLAVLMTKTSTEILTPEGKLALRKELLKAAKAASDEPKVEAVYITEFIVQL